MTMHTHTSVATTETVTIDDSATRQHRVQASGAIARWWANKLRKVPKGLDQFEHARFFEGAAETAMVGAVGGFLVDTILKRDGDVPEETVNAFEARLAQLVFERLAAGYGCGISTDYHPCKILQDAADGLGIKNLDLRLPWKTHTRVGDEFAEGVAGEILWATKREMVRRATNRLLHAWENHDRTPPRWQVFGQVSPDYREGRVEGWSWEANRGPVEAYEREIDEINRACGHVIAKLPFNPDGDISDVAIQVLSDVLARLKLSPLANAIVELAK